MKKPKKKMNVGKELVQRTKNLNKNIESIMGKMAKSESFDINADGLAMYLYSAGDNGNRYTRVDFNDYSTYNDYIMIMDRETLKGMADFINNYLETN
jgi:ferritin